MLGHERSFVAAQLQSEEFTMFESLDALLLARIQFAFTVSFHIIFPAFTIGLASWLAVVEWKYLRTNNPVYRSIYKQWVKIFAVAFGLGVVSGVVLSYQFGTNWSVFSDNTSSVIGPLIGYEVLTAFFLEASFLGIMLFGWGRVTPKMHFVSTVIVAIGTIISSFWILSANSWMQTPAGFDVLPDGRMIANDWSEVIFNPSFPYRLSHMLLAAYLTTSFVVGGVAGYYFLRQRHLEQAKVMLNMALLMAVIVAPLQALMGDLHGLNTLEHQPVKVAAMEGIWETQKGAPLKVFGWPDEEAETTRFSIEIPKLASLILTHDLNGEVKGLKEWPPEDRPPVAIVFWSFRVMVGIGLLMILTGGVGAVLWKRGRLYTTTWFHRWYMLMLPSGFIAILAGWFVTEVGRQPWVVYGVLRTADAISPVPAQSVAVSLLAFIIVYTIIFFAGVYYMAKLVRKGPDPSDSNHPDSYYNQGMQKTLVDHAFPQSKQEDRS